MIEKPVIVVVEKGANYFFHILSVAKINYDNEYGDMYQKSINEEDKKYLKQNEKLLLFGGGNLSNLSHLYTFMPSSLNLDTQDKVNEYFNLLRKSIEANDSVDFYKRYKPVLKESVFFHGDLTNYFQRIISAICENCAGEAVKIAKIYEDSFKYFEDKVWPVEAVKLHKYADKLNELFAERDIIMEFEDLTGMEYKDKAFYIVLCTCNGNGPDANDLAYDTNLHYCGRAYNDIIHFISHEAVVRIISPLFYNADNFSDPLESMAEFYTSLIAGYKWRGYKYFDIFEKIYSMNHDITPKELLKQGIGYYKSHNL